MARVIVPSLEWLLPEPVPDPPSFTDSDVPSRPCSRGAASAATTQLAGFLWAGAGALHDLSRMADADRALDRIDAALAAGSRSRSGATTTPTG